MGNDKTATATAAAESEDRNPSWTWRYIGKQSFDGEPLFQPDQGVSFMCRRHSKTWVLTVAPEAVPPGSDLYKISVSLRGPTPSYKGHMFAPGATEEAIFQWADDQIKVLFRHWQQPWLEEQSSRKMIENLLRRMAQNRVAAQGG